jgi:hypothetical protein
VPLRRRLLQAKFNVANANRPNLAPDLPGDPVFRPGLPRERTEIDRHHASDIREGVHFLIPVSQ